VLFSWWSQSQGEKARTEAFQAFEHLLTVSLLLSPDLESLGLHGLRGDSHRPGVRGLTLHRPVLVDAGRSTETLSGELSAEVLQRSRLKSGVTHVWYGEDPFPLDRILGTESVRRTVLAVVQGNRALHARVRAAARWHAKAHWSYSPEDAVLALGVAFDSLLSERAGLPGRSVAERFAFLDSDARRRSERAKSFVEMYSARSSVAHGGRSSRLDEPEFARRMASELRWATQRLLDVSHSAGATSDSELAAMFDELKWGTRT
jgi:hypothetical protein